VSQAGDHYVSVIVIGSNEPLLKSEASPKIAVIDIVTQLLSVISFWFALSPMAMFGIDIYSHLPIRKKSIVQNAVRRFSQQLRSNTRPAYGNFQPFTGGSKLSADTSLRILARRY
jgi:hypothetical protein